jgi:alpha-L-fucosidase
MNNNHSGTQVLLFQHLKTLLAPHLSMVDEVAEVLNISPDSAYRRIRGEKPISLDEIKVISMRYNLSLDQFLHIKTDSILFSGKMVENKENAFDEWLDNLLYQLGFMGMFPKKHMYWLLKDIPPISHFHIPELALFKFFLWTKSILHYDSMKGVKFDLNDSRYDRYVHKSNLVLDGFSKIPITEIWNIESINSSLRQIRFHYEAGSFKSGAEVVFLLNKLKHLVDHFELQAEAGLKF